VRGEIRYLELDLAGVPVEEPKVLMAGRYVFALREVGRTAGMRSRGFGRGYALDQDRRREESDAAGARKWRKA